MTDNMKKFLEAVSDDQEFIGKLTKAETAEAVIALAKEKGFVLTEEDLKMEEPADELLNDDEVDAVAGGKVCVCVGGGGGEKSLPGVDLLCWCVAAGAGSTSTGKSRCACPGVGGGKSYDD